MAVVMESATTDEVAINYTRLIDKNAAANFQIKFAFGNGCHSPTLNTSGIGWDFDSMADTGNRLVRVKEMACDTDKVFVVTNVFRRPAT